MLENFVNIAIFDAEHIAPDASRRGLNWQAAPQLGELIGLSRIYLAIGLNGIGQQYLCGCSIR